MWIRTQDKATLTNGIMALNRRVGEIYLINNLNTDKQNELRIARYSTQEKATRVLDMIQKEVSLTNDNSVYVMPQEDEVE